MKSRSRTGSVSSIGKKLIKDLERNIYCRLQPSKVHGIGVFAVRDIPKGRELFKCSLDYQLTPVPADLIFKNPKIHPAVKQLVDDVSPMHGGKLYLYRAGLNAIDISFFLNHAKKPNVATKKNSGSFFAGRNIKKGEELLADYADYSEDSGSKGKD